jgi:hypothetical protein
MLSTFSVKIRSKQYKDEQYIDEQKGSVDKSESANPDLPVTSKQTHLSLTTK